ncbi:hypothetical protein DL89DRAFT_95529 [Linderina pennispora]|uniref:Uncharacterized protein n=1 Tax=Linderina pennispora TaxID=61395 RepID=A0A1Y1VXQ0_9FUNG|nr:uncharacterized protein DL89DRAFT_95529 [Linderina pennispora]ORX65786.1 hypothetical protein DL89DRAFT_95529 [Linderina pennispora]
MPPLLTSCSVAAPSCIRLLPKTNNSLLEPPTKRLQSSPSPVRLVYILCWHKQPGLSAGRGAPASRAHVRVLLSPFSSECVCRAWRREKLLV